MYYVYTDGACYPNPGNGGWALVILNENREEIFRQVGGAENTTNNRMELLAIIKALEYFPAGSPVTLYTDSQYCQKGIMLWVKGWHKKHWLRNGKPVPNHDLWRIIYDLLLRLQVDACWVPGHSGDEYNELVDSLANRISLNPMMVDESACKVE